MTSKHAETSVLQDGRFTRHKSNTDQFTFQNFDYQIITNRDKSKTDLELN